MVENTQGPLCACLCVSVQTSDRAGSDRAGSDRDHDGNEKEKESFCRSSSSARRTALLAERAISRGTG